MNNKQQAKFSHQFPKHGLPLTLKHCRSIPVCENTKTESIYFDGKFPSKYID